MANAGFRHDWDGDSSHDLLDQFGAGHAGHAALGANHCGNAFERHDGNRAGLFRDASLFDVHHVHDDAALEHFGEARLETQRGGAEIAVPVMGAVVPDICHEFSLRCGGACDVL